MCAPVHAEEQRDVRTWEGKKKQMKGGRERSSEQDDDCRGRGMELCGQRNWTRDPPKKSNERSMTREKTPKSSNGVE